MIFEAIESGPSGLSESEFIAFQDAIPIGIAAYVQQRYVAELRCLYPSILSDSELRAYGELIHGEISGVFEKGKLRFTSEWPYLAVGSWHEVDVEISTIGGVLLAWLKNVNPESLSDEVVQSQIQTGLKNSIILQQTSNSLSPLMFACDFPHPSFNAGLDSNERFFGLLDRYWNLARELFLIDFNSWVRFNTHPLIRWLISLRSRVEACFNKLNFLPEFTEARDAADSLFAWVLEGDGDWGIIEDYANGQLKKVDLFIEMQRSKNRWLQEQFYTNYEQLFYQSCTKAISWHRVAQKKRRKALEVKIESQIKKKNDSGSSPQHDSPSCEFHGDDRVSFDLANGGISKSKIPVELISLAEFGQLLGVKEKTLQNEGDCPTAKTPKTGRNSRAMFSYGELRTWALSKKKWKECYARLPEDYIQATETLRASQVSNSGK